MRRTPGGRAGMATPARLPQGTAPTGLRPEGATSPPMSLGGARTQGSGPQGAGTARVRDPRVTCLCN